jgi:hypothetical protein
MKKILLVLSLFCLIILGFVFNPFQPKNTSPIKAFYFWKNYDDFWFESDILDTLQVRKLYVKYFEVDYDSDLGPIPVSKTDLSLSRTEWDYENQKYIPSKFAKLSVIPTVFILNSVFKDTIFEEVINKYKLLRTRLMWVGPYACYSMHTDQTLRVHVPLITNSECYFVFKQGIVQHMPAGSVYWTNTLKPHTFINCSDIPRLHLIGVVSR